MSKGLMRNVDDYIKMSGYRLEFLQKKLNINKVSFWRKRKNAKFTIEEMEILSNYIFTDEVEDQLMLEKMGNFEDHEFLSSAESEKFINEL